VALIEPKTRPSAPLARDIVKRILVGRRMTTERMEHTLLPKVLALPIFASDALSSVAYCVEASLLILLTSSANVRSLIIPVNLAVAAVMAIVITSYKQVVRAYPTSAGSYVVSKENLAPIFGLIAAAALLADYVLTVAVSVSAGVVAVISAVPSLHSALVPLSLGCVALLTIINLRGVRESGVMFAIPTYGFIVSMFALIIVGFVKCLGGCPQVQLSSLPDPYKVGAVASVGVFVILHSFASGSSALTGTEAISNGVSAFRRPQGRNASKTLTLLGVIAVTMIMGTAYLAYKTNPLPDHKVSVVSEIAKVVFPGSRPGSGGPMFYAVQFFTLLILILAANTSFQGFPRLSALLARDRYIPRQFENLGDRLVYSNGMIVLAVLAALLIVKYDANVDKLLQLYVVGVFTAFTLSQTGMVRYWRRAAKEGGDKAEGWHWRLVVNAVGAVATALVLVIVVITKFRDGAYVVIAAIPILIVGFYAVHRHYAAVSEQLRTGAVTLAESPRNFVLLYVESLDAATAEAVGFVRSFAGHEFRAFHVTGGPGGNDVAERWKTFCRTEVELEIVPGGKDRVEAAIAFIRGIPREEVDFISVVIPERFSKRSLLAAIRGRTTFNLKRKLLAEPQVVITDVPVLAEREDRPEDLRPWIPQRVEVLVFVSALNDPTIRAINYARSLKATEARAVFFAFEPDEAEGILAEWQDRHIPLGLDIVEAPFRELDAPMLDEVRKVTRGRSDSIAVVVLPETRVRKWIQELLHNQRALFVKRLMLFEERVILSSVPFRLD